MWHLEVEARVSALPVWASYQWATFPSAIPPKGSVLVPHCATVDNKSLRIWNEIVILALNTDALIRDDTVSCIAEVNLK